MPGLDGPYLAENGGGPWPTPFPWQASAVRAPVIGFSLSLVSGPASEVIDVTTAKLNSRIDYADEDTLFSIWTVAARQMIEQECALRLINQTWKASWATWPADGLLQLPVSPVSSITSLQYYDVNGTLQTLAEGTDFLSWLDYRPPLAYPAPQRFWPVAQFGRLAAVQCTFVAGFGSDATAVPAFAKQAILLCCEYWARNRGDEEAPEKLGLPPGALALMRRLDQWGYR